VDEPGVRRLARRPECQHNVRTLVNQSSDEALRHPKLIHRQNGRAALAEQCQRCLLEHLIRHVQGSLRQYGRAETCATSTPPP